MAESIERGHIFDYQGNQYKLLSLAEDGIVARDLKTKQEVLLPKGEKEGAPEGIDGMKLVKLGQPKKGAKSLSEVLKAKEAPEKITNIQKLENWANETVDRIKSEGRLNVGIDPEFLAAQSVKAAFEIARGAKNFGKWSSRMIREFGKEIKPHLNKIWQEARKIHDNPELAEKYNIFRKDAEAPVAEAQPQTTDEKQKQKTGGLPTEQGQSIDQQATEQAQAGTTQREGEGQEKIASAAYRQPETGDIYTGEDHQSAALGAGFEAPANPADREGPEYEYMTTFGRFVSREEGEQISKAAGQFKGKLTDRPVMHSQETGMTDHPEAPESIPADMFSKNPRGAMAANIAFGIDKYVEKSEDRNNIRDALAGKADLTSRGEKELRALLKILDLTTDDLTVLGLKTKGLEKVKNIHSSFQKAVQTLGDVVDVRRIGNLSRAGVKLQAYQHASARAMVGTIIEDLLAKVFPTSYKSKEAMEKTMDIIVKDNILGGYETAVDELGKIKEELDNAKADKADGKKPKSIDNTISEISARYNRQVKFIKNIELF